MRPNGFLPSLLLGAALLTLGCGPVGPLSGGRLGGESGPADQRDWSFAASEETAQLETRPDDPYSVNIWFTTTGEQLYVPTSMILGPVDPAERSWVANALADPRVRIRLAGRVFERTARRVEASDEYETARTALESKYELDPAERDPERTVWIFRLDPPAPADATRP